MFTSHPLNPAIAVEGLTVGERKTKPRTLPYRAQTTTIVFTAGSETDDVVLTVVDDLTQQSYSITTDGSATEATMLASLTAGIRANAKLNSLFSCSDDATLTETLVARHANRRYTITVTGGPSTTPAVVTNTVTAGGAGIAMGRFVVRGSADGQVDVISATSTLADIEGAVFRTDGNHFHALDNELPTDEDLLARGGTYPIMDNGRMWVKVEEAVTPASRVYVRRALTAGAGRLGGFRDTPTGVAQVATLTPIADHPQWSVRAGVRINGELRVLEFSYTATDGTTTADDAVDGLEDAAAAAITAQGFTGIVSASTASGATFTLTAAIGYEFEFVDGTHYGLDTEAESVTVSVAAADVDTIDVTSIASFETSAAAEGLALLRVKLA